VNDDGGVLKWISPALGGVPVRGGCVGVNGALGDVPHNEEGVRDSRKRKWRTRWRRLLAH
jgi:hypothetical protein